MGECKTVQKEIGGRTWQILQMPPSVSLPIWAQLLTVGSGIVGPMLAQSTSLQQAIEVGLGAIGTAMATHLPPEEFTALAKTLASPDFVRVGEEGTPVNFEIDFAGDSMVDLFKVIAAVVEVNYAQFFRELLASGKILEEIAARVSTLRESDGSPPT